MLHLRLAAIVMLPVLAGCLVESNDLGVDLVQPDDIPVPSGLLLKSDPAVSHTVVNGAYRYQNLVYEGKTPPMAVAAFLLKRMPQHSYRLISRDKDSSGDEVLVFQRGRYTSECTVKRLDFTTRLEVRVRTDKLP